VNTLIDVGAFEAQRPVTPTLTLSSALNPAPAGQAVTLTALVSGQAFGTTQPTGMVTFLIDATPQAPLSLVNGQAGLALPTLAVGPHTVTVTYSGDLNLDGGTQTLTQTVAPLATITTLNSAPNPSVLGQPVTFTATVSSQVPGAGTPGGAVTFSVNGAPQTSVPVVNGIATLTLTTLPPGTHMVTAAYGGDANFTSSTAAVSETVQGLQDVTGMVRVTPVSQRPNRNGRRRKANPLMQTLQIRNVGSSTIAGPVYLVLDGLTGGVRLLNATGVSQTQVRPGDPFVSLGMGPLGAGQSVTVNLLFTARNPNKLRAVNFTPFVVAGPGTV
jgi:hypothetical protein